MHEIWLKVYSYLRGTWRFRWYAILVAWIITMAGWPVVMQMPDQYQSSARIHVDTDSLLRPLLRGLTIEPNMGQRLRLMTRTLLSRPNLEKIARMTDMDLSAQTPQQMEILLGKLEKKINLRADARGPNLYTITYEDSNPQLAKNVVQAVVSLFIETALGQTHKDRDSAYQFLEQRIAEYENRLRETEAKLIKIKREHKGAMPRNIGDYFQHLEATEKKLQAARSELDAMKIRRDELRRQIQGKKFLADSDQPAKAGAGPLSHIDNRIKALEVKLDDLLLKYTERHPEVAATQEFLESLRQQKQALRELEEGSSDEDLPEVTAPNQQLSIALATVEGDIASQKARVAALEEEINRLHTLIDTMPEVALELSELHRIYALDKKNYAALLARRETAEMAEKVEQSADNVKFRVIDPPKLPFQPSGPDRPLLLTMVLLMGLGGGVGFAFFLSQLRPTITTRQDLQDLVELPVLGAISVVWTRRSLLKQRLKLAVLLLSFGLLVAAYGLVLSVDHFDLKLAMFDYLDTKVISWLGV